MDVVRTVTIAAVQESVTEGETAVFTLTRSGPTTKPLTVNIAVEDPGDFLRGNHWQADPVLPAEATFQIGSDTATVSLRTRDDLRDIPDNSLTVTLNAGTGYSTVDGSDSASLTVMDNDTAPTLTLSIDSTDVEEGTTLVITLSRGGKLRNAVEFTVTRGFQGEQETGYTGLDAGETALQWRVETEDDDLDEHDLVYELEVSPVPGVPADAASEYWTLQGSASVSATVRDNDLPLIGVEPRSPSYRENGYGWFQLTRVGRTDYDLQVNTRTTEVGHHIADRLRDWLNRPRVYTIDSDSAIENIAWVLGGDDGDEDDGTLTMKLLPGEGYRIDPDRSTATFRVVDIEPSPTMSIADASASEGGGAVEFTVSLAAERASRRTVTVDYATGNGTATTEDGDYTATSGTLTLWPGRTSATISVPVSDDTLAESDELFTLTLSNLVGAVLADGQTSVVVAGTIEDNEPLVTVEAVNDEVNEGDPVAFRLTRTGSSVGELTVHLYVLTTFDAGLADGPQVVTFPAGAATTNWQHATVDDDEDTADNDFIAYVPQPGSVGAPLTYHAGNQSPTVTVKDNDLPTVTIAADHTDRTEGENVTFTLTRGGYLVPLTVNISATGGDAFVSGARPTSVLFAANATTATLTVATTDDDPEDEHDQLTAAITASYRLHSRRPGQRGGEPVRQRALLPGGLNFGQRRLGGRGGRRGLHPHQVGLRPGREPDRAGLGLRNRLGAIQLNDPYLSPFQPGQ